MAKTQAEGKSVAEVKERWEDAQQFYGSDHSMIGKELAFTLDHQHYTDSNDSDPHRIKPADPGMLNLQRHKAARILKSSTYYEMRGRDEYDDPQAAADGKALLDRYTQDPESEFEDSLEDVVDGALAARIWGCQVGWDPDCSELTFRSIDPRKAFWTPGFKNPHSKRCPWLQIEVQMTPRSIELMKERGWKNTDDVQTDAVAMSTPRQGGSEVPIKSANPASAASASTKFTTVVFEYERFVKETKPQKTYKTLLPGDQYMWCPQCHFKGMPQSYLDAPLPPDQGDPCPDCGATTQHVYADAIEADILAYRKGRRLRIVAPYMAEEFYTGPWEFDTKGFTTVFYSPYNHPVDAIPKSDTFYYRSLTCVSDAMLRLGYEQMRKAHGIILAPQDSLYDAYGDAFPFSEHRDVAYYDTEFLSPNAIQWFQPPGLNAAWSTYFNTVQGVFSANQGTGDLGMTPQQSKDIAVGTIQTIVETGEIPVDRHIRRFQRFKSIVLTRAYEILRSVLTAEIAMRVMGPDGAMAMRRIRASGLPGMDVVVTAEPDMGQVQLKQSQDLMQIAQLPSHLRRFVARGVNLPPQMLQQLETAEAALLAKQGPQTATAPQSQPPPTNRVAGMMQPAPNGAAQ